MSWCLKSRTNLLQKCQQSSASMSLRERNPLAPRFPHHCNDDIMGAMASKITSLTIVYSTVYSGTDKIKHLSYASLAFVRWPVTRKMFPFDYVIMTHWNSKVVHLQWHHRDGTCDNSVIQCRICGHLLTFTYCFTVLMTIECFKQGVSRLIDLKWITKRRRIQSKSTQKLNSSGEG